MPALPQGASARSSAAALSSATLGLGSSALVIAAVLLVLRNIAFPGHDSWAALLLLLPLAGLMVLAHFRRTVPVMVLYLLAGSACIGAYAGIILTNAPSALAESPFLLALPQIAFVYTIAPTVLGGRSIVFIALAYLFGQTAVLLTAIFTGVFPRFDSMTALSAFVILAVGVSNLVFRRRSAVDFRAVERARRESDAIAYQQELEAQVVALFHDTVLSELTVLSHQQPGPLGDTQRAAIRRDLTMIEDGAWWPSHTSGPDRGALPGLVAEVIDGMRSEGLVIEVGGDIASLHRLTPEVVTATALALWQALVNVQQHSGTDRAEIGVDGAPDAVVVMVADAGSGFDEAAVPADRLGVTQSIRGRIHDVGGEVKLWTSPGSGTAYLFTLPVAPEHRWPGEVTRS